ncbi:BA75_02941T0 [Komagataella pastoris]|uniref:BA75_02941T0 n=1 Tax=Komagataella pastoris TaxID=4922 RepID=A0A1B2JAQ7_PICPA|nr:BA75_02941T0 [Komagataella pastoris]
MSINEIVESLIAQYLSERGLKESLAAFKLELNRTFSDNGDLLEERLYDIVEDRYKFLDLKKANEDDIQALNNTVALPVWKLPNPVIGEELVPLGSNLVISTTVGNLKLSNQTSPCIVISTSSNELQIFDLNGVKLAGFEKVLKSISKVVLIIEDSPLLLCGGMDGHLSILDVITEEIQSFQLHGRLLSDMKYLPIDESHGYLVSIGMDNNVTLSTIDFTDIKNIQFSKSQFRMLTRPTCIDFFKFQKHFLVIANRVDTSLISVFMVNDGNELVELCRLSTDDSEFSSHGFQVGALAHHITDEKLLISAATNHIPYMRLITLVLPDLYELIDYWVKEEGKDTDGDLLSKLRSLSINQIHEQQFTNKTHVIRNVILSSVNTSAPQDKYSVQQIATRDSKNGVWIFSDDGVIRGLNLSSGTIIEELKSHEGRIKSAAAFTSNDGDELLFTSGATDRRTKRWSATPPRPSSG